MIDLLCFDTDCISSFLWVDAEYILTDLYSGRIIIPQQVYAELSNPSVGHLRTRLDVLINKNNATVQQILIDSSEYSLYTKLTNTPDEGNVVIGKGEAAAIALASKLSAIAASNNIKDVLPYVSKFNIRHITTGDILVKAYKESLISEAQGNDIWSAMLAKRRRIGEASFTERLNRD